MVKLFHLAYMLYIHHVQRMNMTNTEINVLEKELDFASIQNKINELERRKIFEEDNEN